jgi:drug/metabolite transporter (DMT)-like permease
MTPITKAALWMLGAIVSFSAMAVAGREVSSTLDTFETMLYRSVVGFCIMVVFVLATKRQHEIRRDRLGLHLMRNLAHFTGQNLWFFAVPLIPLAQLFALEFTSPIWVILMAPIFLGERLTRTKALAGVLGFIGVCMVARPDAFGLSPGILAAAGSAIFFALTAIATRRLTQTQSVTCILFYITAMQVVMGLICAGYDGDIALPDAAAAPWVIVISIAGLTAHLCLTSALSLAPASIVFLQLQQALDSGLGIGISEFL